MDGASDSIQPTLQQRLHELGKAEQKIEEMLRYAQSCVIELAKEKQIGKSKMEEASNSFRGALNFVESTLSSNMAYLSNVCVGTPHLGSTFAAHHKMALAAQCEQSLHSELDRLKQLHFPKDERNQKEDQLMDIPSNDTSHNSQTL